MTIPSAVVKDMAACTAYRISPNETNHFAVLFDPEGDGVDFIAVIEIFAPGGRTPPNVHSRAHEMFFVLEGAGRAHCGEIVRDFGKGDAILLRPGATHEIVNTGPGKLYTLTVMVPNEGFAELIRGGTRVTLDADDLRVIRGARSIAI